jgi:hypothetical protein
MGKAPSRQGDRFMPVSNPNMDKLTKYCVLKG